MSSVAVLTQERFNEHRSGLLPEQGGGKNQNQSAQTSWIVELSKACITCFVSDMTWSLYLNLKLLWQDPVRQ